MFVGDKQNKFLLSASDDKHIHVWNLNNVNYVSKIEFDSAVLALD